MPDLPSPQDASEAALFSECWDAVLSYADLCTAGSSAAAELAREAFAEGIRELRAAESGSVRGTGRRSSRLPRVPLLLTAVRNTAAAWEKEGKGHKLDPELRLWLHSDEAARYTGPPLERPVALRGLRDLQQADAELLWLAEAEALPLPLVARRLGLDPATTADELAQVSRLFRDRCHRNHLDSPMDAECRSYARLLDAVTRSPAADAPADLTLHLATCRQCAEAAACLRLNGGTLPGALAGGVIGWGGLAYLERRRRAAEVRLGAGHPHGVDPDADEPAAGRGRKARVVRHGPMAAAVLVSLLALAVSLMPFGDGGDGGTAARDSDRGGPVAAPVPSLPPAGTAPSATATPGSPEPSTPSAAPSRPAPPTRTADPAPEPDPEPQGTSSGTAATPPASCSVDYDVVNEWPDGYQATVTVTPGHTLNGWHVAFTLPAGHRITQMWDASSHQTGSRVTATAADYNATVAQDRTVAFGFIAARRTDDTHATDFALDGETCAVA
ncbi:cellulose-binding domain-containing protein [Streptomyces pseudogriseolus]|uniref:cellulose-binding domain-containing protein n=1 Tax=Streptomyces pseudogriseolus TaxID=36817 RepID=UPI001CE2A66D|nr:cellulose-binding domain-containing protein [Streptomyces pseudogriseolus]